MPDLQTSLELCTFCPRLCSHTCPVSLVAARQTLTPQAKMARAWELHQATATGTAAPASEPLYGCTGCGACTSVCLYHVEPASALLHGRACAERAGVSHTQLAALPQRQRQRAQAAAAAVQADAEIYARAAPAASVAFLPTCLPRRSPSAAAPSGQTPRLSCAETEAGPLRETRAALRVLDRLRAVRPDVPAMGVARLNLGCAGYALYAAGLFESFRLYAEGFARQVESYGTLVGSCAACVWLLRTQYPEHGVPLRPGVLHIAEFLAPYADALPVQQPLPQAFYHDPCFLGRRLGCYEPPRRLLQRATEHLRELLAHHEQSVCCGSGGLLPLTMPAVAADMARERLAELAASGAAPDAVVVSACAACQHQLARHGGQTLDLLELLDRVTSPLAADAPA